MSSVGVMSTARFNTVGVHPKPLRAASKKLGLTLEASFAQIPFLGLALIPHLKITDRTLIDVHRLAFVET